MTTDDRARPNADQITFWNSDASSHWIEGADRHDVMLAPFVPHLLDAADIAIKHELIDIGCGNGATTLAAARRAVDGSAMGMDLSKAMLDIARRRARNANVQNARFEQADAQTYAFEPDCFDRALSRFGVMFFDDPVAAFSNIRRSLRPGGSLTFVCWQSLEVNEWSAVAGAAVAAHVPPGPELDPNAPGADSLARPERIRELLAQAQFTDVEILPLEELLNLGRLKEAVEFLTRSGRVRRMLAEADTHARSRAHAALTAALEPYENSEGVALGSRVWLVRARRA
jgi:SAM-dependent methyltransferase